MRWTRSNKPCEAPRIMQIGYSCIKPPKGALRELNDQSLHCSGMNDAIYVSLFCPLFMRLLLNLNQKQTNISLTKYTF